MTDYQTKSGLAVYYKEKILTASSGKERLEIFNEWLERVEILRRWENGFRAMRAKTERAKRRGLFPRRQTGPH